MTADKGESRIISCFDKGSFAKPNIIADASSLILT